MDQVRFTEGLHGTVASDISLVSKKTIGESTISICSEGMGQLTGTGMLELKSNGSIVANAGNATIQMGTDITTQSNVLIDGGLLGNVTLANGAPIGNAQTVKMDSTLQSIEISNGNVPGAMQSITLCGLTQSVEITAGGTPVSPTINMSPLGIKMSCGPTSSIEITPAGIKISGLMVDVEGTAQASVKGAMVSVEGQGGTTIKGLMVAVN